MNFLRSLINVILTHTDIHIPRENYTPYIKIDFVFFFEVPAQASFEFFKN